MLVYINSVCCFCWPNLFYKKLTSLGTPIQHKCQFRDDHDDMLELKLTIRMGKKADLKVK